MVAPVVFRRPARLEQDRIGCPSRSMGATVTIRRHHPGSEFVIPLTCGNGIGLNHSQTAPQHRQVSLLT
jgi:hypothetical protein